VPKFERVLIDAGILDEPAIAALRASVLRETNDATDAAEALPLVDAASMYDNVYAGPYEPWQA
jgi:TPP-dependent pyruvate/acetoin dehydrogenase alpha subunit